MGVPSMDKQALQGVNHDYCGSLKKGLTSDTGISATRGTSKGSRRPAMAATKPKLKSSNIVRANTENLSSASCSKVSTPSKSDFLQDASAAEYRMREASSPTNPGHFRGDGSVPGHGRFSAQAQHGFLEGRPWCDDLMHSVMVPPGVHPSLYDSVHTLFVNPEEMARLHHRGYPSSELGPSFEGGYAEEELLHLHHLIAQEQIQIHRQGHDRIELKRTAPVAPGVHDVDRVAMAARLQSLNLSSELAAGMGGASFHHSGSPPLLQHHQLLNSDPLAFVSEFGPHLPVHGLHDGSHGEFPLCHPDEMRPLSYEDAFLTDRRRSPPLTSEFAPQGETPWLRQRQQQHHMDVVKGGCDTSHLHRNHYRRELLQQQQSLQYVHEHELRQQFHLRQQQQQQQQVRYEKQHAKQQQKQHNHSKRTRTPPFPSPSSDACPPSTANTSPRSVLEIAPRSPRQTISLSHGTSPWGAPSSVHGGYDQGGLWRPANSQALSHSSQAQQHVETKKDGKASVSAGNSTLEQPGDEDTSDGFLPSDADFQFSLAEVWLS